MGLWKICDPEIFEILNSLNQQYQILSYICVIKPITDSTNQPWIWKSVNVEVVSLQNRIIKHKSKTAYCSAHFSKQSAMQPYWILTDIPMNFLGYGWFRSLLRYARSWGLHWATTFHYLINYMGWLILMIKLFLKTFMIKLEGLMYFSIRIEWKLYWLNECKTGQPGSTRPLGACLSAIGMILRAYHQIIFLVF